MVIDGAGVEGGRSWDGTPSRNPKAGTGIRTWLDFGKKRPVNHDGIALDMLPTHGVQRPGDRQQKGWQLERDELWERDVETDECRSQLMEKSPMTRLGSVVRAVQSISLDKIPQIFDLYRRQWQVPPHDT